MVVKKPSEAEEEFFARIEAEKNRQRMLDNTRALGDAERERLRVLHHMRCPKCGMPLSPLRLRGVEVERCFGCNGLFLDEADVKQLIEDEGYLGGMLNFFAAGHEGEGGS